MATQNYFIASASNPVEMAEKNLPFYKEFVENWGCHRSYKNLWPGQNLAAFICSFTFYAKNSGNRSLIRKAKLLKSTYSALYERLTQSPLMQSSVVNL